MSRRIFGAGRLPAAACVAVSLALGACANPEQAPPGDEAHDVPPAGAGGPWEDARLRGATFRAVGQEPGWTLDVHPDRLVYLGDYGETSMVTPAPEPDRSASGTVVYDAATEAHELRVTIREERCADTMSGVVFSHAVTLVVDGRELSGCGQPLSPSTIDGIEWRLVALGGTPAVAGPAGAAPHIELNVEGPVVTGSTGCNRLRGPVERSGDRLRFGALAMTRMACTDPARAQQESDFVRALEQVDRFERAGDELTLYAGSTAVARFRAVRQSAD